MSRVFLAHEKALGRHVVVKVLSGELTQGLSAERFAREVRFAASLQHPNIVPVLTTGVADGTPWYTMPYIKGESLRARMSETPPLPRRQALSILRDVARALQYAHSEGVVHRDIKPENILLSSDAAVVTDFGIAKAISAARTSTADHSETQSGSTITQAGTAVGTPAYMAPEQIAGDTIDNRADIYAWGLVAYELLAGQHPFSGQLSSARLMAAQLSQAPTPLSSKAPDISPEISRIIMRCLEKSPESRPSSVLEVLQNLEEAGTGDRLAHPATRRARTVATGLSAVAAIVVAAGVYAYLEKGSKPATPPAASSVAILPFAEDRADSANAYFGEGIAEELMTELSKVPGLRVASRTSTIKLGRSNLDVREIGRRLGVATVVEGTVRRSGGQLRVTAQLTNAADGLILWSDSYARESKDVFAVQDDITRAIVDALRPELSSRSAAVAQKPRGPGTSNPEAYDLYLRGTYLLERRGAGVARAAEYFSAAIEKDSTFARAYAGLASALEFFPYFTETPAERIESRARFAAERSLSLDPSLSEPRVALAMAHWHALRWNNAVAEFEAAIKADSTYPVAHIQYGRMLLSRGQVGHALAQFRIARRLDPLGATAAVWLAAALGYSGDHVRAWEESVRARELDPNLATAHTFLAIERINAGRLDQARALVGDRDWPMSFMGQVGYALHRSGERVRAAAIRKQLDAMPDSAWMVHTARVFAHLALPDTSRALSEMEAALDRHEVLTTTVPFVDPMFDPVRTSARFASVLRRFGLEDSGLAGSYR